MDTIKKMQELFWYSYDDRNNDIYAYEFVVISKKVCSRDLYTQLGYHPFINHVAIWGVCEVVEEPELFHQFVEVVLLDTIYLYYSMEVNRGETELTFDEWMKSKETDSCFTNPIDEWMKSKETDSCFTNLIDVCSAIDEEYVPTEHRSLLLKQK